MKVRDRFNLQFKRIRFRKCALLLSLSLVACILLIVLLILLGRVPIVRNVVFILDTENDLGQTMTLSNGDIEIEGCCWEVEGWTYYTDRKDFGNYQPKRKSKLGQFNGIWMPIASNNVIKLTFERTILPLASIGLGLRIYVEGDAGVTISFSYKSQSYTEIIKLIPSLTNQNSIKSKFCNKIINIPLIQEGALIDQIEIKGTLPRDDGSFVAIDKVIVTRGNDGTSRSLLYTLLPHNWCESMGIHFQTF